MFYLEFNFLLSNFNLNLNWQRALTAETRSDPLGLKTEAPLRQAGTLAHSAAPALLSSEAGAAVAGQWDTRGSGLSIPVPCLAHRRLNTLQTHWPWERNESHTFPASWLPPSGRKQGACAALGPGLSSVLEGRSGAPRRQGSGGATAGKRQQVGSGAPCRLAPLSDTEDVPVLFKCPQLFIP